MHEGVVNFRWAKIHGTDIPTVDLSDYFYYGHEILDRAKEIYKETGRKVKSVYVKVDSKYHIIEFKPLRYYRK